MPGIAFDQPLLGAGRERTNGFRRRAGAHPLAQYVRKPNINLATVISFTYIHTDPAGMLCTVELMSSM
jgi:hypothetical protein